MITQTRQVIDLFIVPGFFELGLPTEATIFGFGSWLITPRVNLPMPNVTKKIRATVTIVT